MIQRFTSFALQYASEVVKCCLGRYQENYYLMRTLWLGSEHKLVLFNKNVQICSFVVAFNLVSIQKYNHLFSKHKASWFHEQLIAFKYCLMAVESEEEQRKVVKIF